MAEDFDRVRVSICGILGLDPARLTGLEALHVDVAAVLRFVIDDLMAAAAAGRTIDVQKLKLASEALTPLLPPKPPLLDERSRKFVGDPAKRLSEIVLAAIHRMPQTGPIEVTPVSELETLRSELAEARAELARYRGEPPAQRALPAPSEPSPPDAAEPDVAEQVEHAEPDAPAPQPGGLSSLLASTPAEQAGGSAGFRVGPATEPWREHVSADNGFFWSGARGRSW